VLRSIEIQGFKSLRRVRVELPRLTVLLGPNAAGKSNFIDALLGLSLLATERTLADAIAPIRGYPVEAFTLPSGGLEALLRKKRTSFQFDADIQVENSALPRSVAHRFNYSSSVQIEPATGALSVGHEFLVALDRAGNPKGLPRIEPGHQELTIRPQRQGRPWHEPLGMNHTLLSDQRLTGEKYRDVDAVRSELGSWRVYYLDPRVQMRRATPPSEVADIGALGENLAPFLYELKHRYRRNFDAVRRAVRSVIPSIRSIDVDLNTRRGELDLIVHQDGVPYSSRVISEGTLRVLALCALALHPQPSSLVAFEEPENGVHPHRLEMIADLLLSVVRNRGTQVVVTTHSPILGAAMLRRMRETPIDIGLFVCSLQDSETVIRRLEPSPGTLFDDQEILGALSDPRDDVFEEMLVRGWLDA
jgi:predicted ATPase